MTLQDRDIMRESILSDEISKLARQKWRVVSQGRFNAQLERQALTCSQTLILIGMLLCLIIPGLIYAAMIGKGKTAHLYIEVTPDGKIKRRKQ